MAAAVGEGKGCAVAGSPEARGGRGGSGGLPAEQEREGNPAAAPVLPGFDDVDAFVKVRGGAGARREGRCALRLPPTRARFGPWRSQSRALRGMLGAAVLPREGF